MMLPRRIVEVLDKDPYQHAVIVPIYERLLTSQMQDVSALGFWEALFMFAHGELDPLTSILQRDAAARELLASFDEHWIVRAEEVKSSECEARVKNIGEAVVLARALCERQQSKRDLEIRRGTSSDLFPRRLGSGQSRGEGNPWGRGL